MPRPRTIFWARCQYVLNGCAVSKEFDIDGPYPLNAMNAIANMNKNTWGGTMLSCRLYNMDFETGAIAEDPVLVWNAREFNKREVARIPTTGGYTSPEEVEEAEDVIWGPWKEYEKNTPPRNDPNDLTAKHIHEMGYEVRHLALPKFSTIRFKQLTKEVDI